MKNKNKWINLHEQPPEKERFYLCLCLGFNRAIKCKFRMKKNGPREWHENFFIHKGRVPRVLHWREK